MSLEKIFSFKTELDSQGVFWYFNIANDEIYLTQLGWAIT